MRDNGVGIPSADLTRIFGHGFTTRQQGSGFGLHISALAAREMNAELSVESEGIGRGASFSLHLPLSPHNATLSSDFAFTAGSAAFSVSPCPTPL